MLAIEYENDGDNNFLPVYPYFFYQIVCNDPFIKKCYIGKTKDFKNREATHKSKSFYCDIPLYQVIRMHGGWNNWSMKLYHKSMCDDPSSIYIEFAIIKQFKDNGYDLLNCQSPCDYPRQEYNKIKCREHYAIKKECACGWFGSKMDWAHHQKSKRHQLFIVTGEVIC